MDAYRNLPEESGLNWTKHFRIFFPNKSFEDMEYDIKQLEKLDAWAPEDVLTQFVDSHLDQLFASSERLYEMSLKIPFYAFYQRIIDKAILLLLERSPDSFEQLSDMRKKQALGVKLEMPDEVQFYGHVYSALQKPASEVGSYYTGQNFEDIVERLVNEENILSPELGEILRSIDASYAIYFVKRNAEQK
jgi:hypothetical protein